MPNATFFVTSAAYCDAISSKSGFDLLQGPHHVAEKQMTAFLLLEMNDWRAAGDSSSWSVIVAEEKIILLAGALE